MDSIEALATLPNGNLASGSGSYIRIYDPKTGSLVFTLTNHTSYVYALAILPNGNLASGSYDDTVKIWNPINGSLVLTLKGHLNGVCTLVTLPNGNLASGSWDNTVKLWNPNSGSLVYTLTGHTHAVFTLAILPNGNLASGSVDSTVKIWNPNTGELVFTLTGHLLCVYTLATLANGNLASGSYDKTVKLWNPNSGSLVYTLTGHTNTVFTLATLPNGNLASGSDDNTINIWNLNSLVYSNIPSSGYSSTEFNFKILNDQAFDLTLYWVDQSHNFVNYANINIGQTYFQQSYSSHVWVLSNSLNNKCFVFKLSTTNQFKLSNRIVKVSNMSDIQCDPYDVPLQYSYWKTQNRDHYFAVSSIINNYCYEFDSGKIIFIFTLDRQNSSQTVLFDSSRSAYVLLDSSKAQFSYLGNPYYVFDYGGWVSSKRNNF